MRHFLTSAYILITASCLVTMMAVFLGSQAHTLGLALLVQAAFTPFIITTLVVYTWLSISRVGIRELLDLYRRHIAGWMWFAFWSINSLVIAGELSFMIVHWASDQRPPWLEHAPLWCAAACTFALLAMYIWAKTSRREVK